MNHKVEIKKDILKVYGREPRSTSELAECVIKVIDRKTPVAGFAWDIRRDTSVSNTHDCPIDGVTNWGGRDQNRPFGYPGWEGRVWIRYKSDKETWGSDPFHATLTYPGTGGWRGSYDGPWQKISRAWHKAHPNQNKKGFKPRYPQPQVYGWDYRFFDSDWPDLYYTEIFDIIKGSKRTKHKFLWEDPEVVDADRDFISKFDNGVFV